MSTASHDAGEERRIHMRRTSDGLSIPMLMSGLPVRLQAILLIIFWLGPSALAALFFMSMWAGWLPSPVTDNNKILVRMEAKLETAVSDMKKEVEQSHFRDESVIRLLWATCRNVSKTDAEKTLCDNYWKR